MLTPAHNLRGNGRPRRGVWLANVLSIRITGYSEYSHSAHGRVEAFALNFLTETGAQISSLGQVFKPGFEKRWEAFTAPTVTKVLGPPEKDEDYEQKRVSLSVAFEKPRFVFVEGGMRFYPGYVLPQVWSYLEEEPRTFTIAELAPLLDPESPVARLWKP